MLFTTLDIRIRDSAELIPLFLTASCAYYRLKESFMSDATFDFLVMRILKEWDDLEHPYKGLISKENLETDSAFNIDFPQDIMLQAQAWLKEAKEEL